MARDLNCYGNCEALHKRGHTLDANYAVTMFPQLRAAEPTPQALYREEFAKKKAADRRNRVRPARRTTAFARLEAERELDAIRSFSQPNVLT